MQTIGLNLKRIRIEKQIKQRKLSELSGVSRSYISEIESNTHDNITVNVICKLCKALEITPNELIPQEMYK